MRKIGLILTLLFFTNVNSQVQNLEDLLIISSMSTKSLIINLQQNYWKSKYTTNRTKEKYIESFTFLEEDSKQAIKRVVSIDLKNTNLKVETTLFYANDVNLFGKIRREIDLRGFKLVKEGDNNVSFAKMGTGTRSRNIFIDIDISAFKARGFYKISVLIM